jgi:hypothetical protein
VERLFLAGVALGILLAPLLILVLLAWLVPAAIASLAAGNEAFN